MTFEELLNQCGTVEVRVAPLLILIGAVVRDSPVSVEEIVEMLDIPEAGKS